jgi:hypothetical protein
LSHISCLLCGLQRPVRGYDPSNYENELYLITKKSKGYAAGFEDECTPILGDDIYTPIIKDRILEITQYFVKREIISKEEIAEMLFDEDVKIDKFFTEKEHYQVTIAGLRQREYNHLRKLRSKDNEITQKEIENRELKELESKLKAESDKLRIEHGEITQTHIDIIKLLMNMMNETDLLNYVLMHILKYCDAHILGNYINDLQINLMSLDYHSSILFGCLYEGLTVDEWLSLMKKINGPIEVRMKLDYLTKMKMSEENKQYNRALLLRDLQMFRTLKLSLSQD